MLDSAVAVTEHGPWKSLLHSLEDPEGLAAEQVVYEKNRHKEKYFRPYVDLMNFSAIHKLIDHLNLFAQGILLCNTAPLYCMVEKFTNLKCIQVLLSCKPYSILTYTIQPFSLIIIKQE